MKKVSIVLLAFAAVVAACSSTHQTSSTPALATQPVIVLSAGELLMGQSIYSSNCASCHDLPEPKKYSQQRWTSDILPEMFVKAKLDTSQQRLVQGYVISQL